MRRRDLLANLMSLAIVTRASAEDRRIQRVGVLFAGSSSSSQQNFDDAMKALGWFPGKTLMIDYRTTGGNTEQTQAAARELISLRPNVLFAMTNTSMAALFAEGSTIPTRVRDGQRSNRYALCQ
jgi:putative tryptophan/tyrosine transport system substrate-binding protein